MSGPRVKEKAVQSQFVEGIDYYIKDGRWVFTAHYLRKRGYCCQSGCTHCPYELVSSIEKAKGKDH